MTDKGNSKGTALVLLGTRPEVIKLVPIIEELKKSNWDVILVNTAQQAELSFKYLKEFGITANHTLNVTSSGFDLEQVFSEVLRQLGDLIRKLKPTCLFVQGDTTTVAASALAAFYSQIPCFHVEAGLRTHIKYSPFPEEGNRTLVANLANLHFAPTQLAMDNLIQQGISKDEVLVTGNTGIDTLRREISQDTSGSNSRDMDPKKRIYASVHRREHTDSELGEILSSIRSFADRNLDWEIIFQVHTNPRIHKFVENLLSNSKNISLVEPLAYHEIVVLLKTCNFLMTDSGGLQEEAYAVGCPLIILRKSTERPEVVDSERSWLCDHGFADLEVVMNDFSFKFKSFEVRSEIVNTSLGDGFAAKKIVAAVERYFGGAN